VINYRGRASELGGIVNLVDRRRSSFDDRYAKPKFSKSGVLDRFAEGSALIRPPALREAQERRAYVLLMFYFLNYILNDCCQTNYLNIYRADFRFSVRSLCKLHQRQEHSAAYWPMQYILSLKSRVAWSGVLVALVEIYGPVDATLR